MKKHALLVAALGMVAAQPSHVFAAAHPHHPRRSHPIVATASLMEWFSRPVVSAGAKETVYIRAWNRGAPLAGARMQVRVLRGSRVLERLGAGRTGRHGRDQATFHVPRVRHGVRLTIRVTLLARREVITGTNQVRVR